MSEHGEHESHAGITAEIRARAGAWMDDKLKQYDERLADRLDAAHKREVDALKQRCVELDAEIAAKDEVTKRLNDAIAEEQRRKMATTEKSSAVGNAAKLREADHNWDAICEKCLEGEPPDGCRYYGEPNGCNSPMYGEYPKPFGENAAVLRSAIIEILLEMEDMAGLEVGRKYRFSPDAIAQQCRAALATPPRNCDVGTVEEQSERFYEWCSVHRSPNCPAKRCRLCILRWAQMPYMEKEGGAK